MAQVVERLLSKHKTLDSIHSTLWCTPDMFELFLKVDFVNFVNWSQRIALHNYLLNSQ
jgi:hypothetical protein